MLSWLATHWDVIITLVNSFGLVLINQKTKR